MGACCLIPTDNSIIRLYNNIHFHYACIHDTVGCSRYTYSCSMAISVTP